MTAVAPASELIVRQYDFLRDFETVLRPTACEVHVWMVEASPDNAQRLSALLSPQETERAGRIRVPQPRDEYIAGRATLRTLLGRYLAHPTTGLRFAYTEHDKPWLEHPLSSLTFNLSHSGGLVLIAIGHGRRVGVDIEKIRRDFDVEPIAERFFSPAERDMLRQVPRPAKTDAFFRCWTRKEAYIKALGEGLSHPLHQFDVDFAAGCASLLHTRPDPQEAARWTLAELRVPHGYVAALAGETQTQTVSTA